MFLQIVFANDVDVFCIRVLQTWIVPDWYDVPEVLTVVRKWLFGTVWKGTTSMQT